MKRLFTHVKVMVCNLGIHSGLSQSAHVLLWSVAPPLQRFRRIRSFLRPFKPRCLPSVASARH
jgi:hypothetical protein